jgi:hypothetical protein
VPFNVARLDSSVINPQLQGKSNVSFISSPLGLAPFFSSNSSKLFRLPLILQPSDWHVIWRSLDESIDDSLSGFLQFDGLSMDTF